MSEDGALETVTCISAFACVAAIFDTCAIAIASVNKYYPNSDTTDGVPADGLCATDDIEFSLNIWLLLASVSGLIVTCVLTVRLILMTLLETKPGFGSVCFDFASVMWNFSWWVVGIVLLQSLLDEGKTCEERYRDVWIMSMNIIFFMAIKFTFLVAIMCSSMFGSN